MNDRLNTRLRKRFLLDDIRRVARPRQSASDIPGPQTPEIPKRPDQPEIPDIPTARKSDFPSANIEQVVRMRTRQQLHRILTHLASRVALGGSLYKSPQLTTKQHPRDNQYLVRLGE